MYGNDAYRRINRALEAHSYLKKVEKRNGDLAELPANTYVAKIEGQFRSQLAVVERVESDIRHVFRACGVRGKFFIVCGRRWAWKRGHF